MVYSLVQVAEKLADRNITALSKATGISYLVLTRLKNQKPVEMKIQDYEKLVNYLFC